MILGTTIHNLAGATYYSPSFPRGGDAATFIVEVTAITTDTMLNIDVEHRNVDETTFASAATFTGITAVGVSTKDIASLKEMIRFKLSLAGTNSSGMVHYTMQAPSWRTY